jgi:threonine/homoserine/homoserine lactone efflux protein
LQAIPAEILNPKTALFFLAFMPQFVRPDRGSTLLQFATLGLIFVVLSSCYTTLLVLAIQPLGRLLKRVMDQPLAGQDRRQHLHRAWD